MNEWGIALVGFVGALVGAVVGFFGLRWQRRAEVWQDIRKNAAQLYMKGMKIMRAYDDVANPARGFNSTPVAETAAALASMQEIVAYLELVADVKTHRACSGFVGACEEMQLVHSLLAKDRNAIHAPGWNETIGQWANARDEMLNRVRANKLPRTPLWILIKNRQLFTNYRRKLALRRARS